MHIDEYLKSFKLEQLNFEKWSMLPFYLTKKFQVIHQAHNTSCLILMLIYG